VCEDVEAADVAVEIFPESREADAFVDPQGRSLSL
jgi:hypothetical protein